MNSKENREKIRLLEEQLDQLSKEKTELRSLLVERDNYDFETIESAKHQIKKQLSYRLGSAIVSKTKERKFLSYLSIPFVLLKEYRNFKKEQNIVKEYSDKKTISKPKNIQVGGFNYTRYFKEWITTRQTVEELYAKCENYDVISFDIFDTALIRRVEYPTDLFDIISIKIKDSTFSAARKKAEKKARDKNEHRHGHREITIYDIYNELSSYGFSKDLLSLEIESELNAVIAHPLIFDLYRRLLDSGKTIVFMSDMYLPLSVIERMLRENGYEKFDRIFLSNEYKKNKSRKELQLELLNTYRDKKIIHLGDSLMSDKVKTEECGIDAEWVPDVRLKYREPYLNNIAGSIYRAVLNNSVNSNVWLHDKFYTAGFRYGGLLTAGYCKYINRLSQSIGIEKILFCSRDCYIIDKVYNSLFKKLSSHYIDISRYAVLNLSPEKYAIDILHRFIFRYWDENRNKKTIGQVLNDTGYGYLTAYLDENDIEEHQYCGSFDKQIFEDFFLRQIPRIADHNKPSIDAAIKYYKPIIGKFKNILIVDIGWSGTCITALEYFLHKHISNEISVTGALLCTSDKKELCNEVISSRIYSYICSPANNSDLERFMMPNTKSVEEQDIVHMPLEYMFTSTNASLIKYSIENERIRFIRDRNVPPNRYQIEQIHNGIQDFCSKYKLYENKFGVELEISPYTAFIPLKQLIQDKNQVKDLYKDFIYDACTAPYAEGVIFKRFSSLFKDTEKQKLNVIQKNRESIVFISPEMIYVGAPRSLLRTAKIARKLNYNVIVWCRKEGPFIKEFIENGFDVEIVDIKKAETPKYTKILKQAKLVYCNTIVTDDYVRLVKKLKCPVIWFIREATNIPDFCRNNTKRLETLRMVDDIYCVSEYAAEAISKFTDRKIRILKNCVEDERDLAINSNSCHEKIRFAQYGTIEYRKGYDVLLKAFKALPNEYKQKAELYFAGGFVNSGTSFCAHLFTEMQDEKNVHYQGLIQGESRKIQNLSSMDVIVVASRDESCSLVALEGAMLSKPLIVTDHVGAKYIVGDDNGIIVRAGDVQSMTNALIKMIDNREHFSAMGKVSRSKYESLANMNYHENELRKAFDDCVFTPIQSIKSKNKTELTYPNVLISLTSYPARIASVHLTIKSLLNQKYPHFKIVLWLSKSQFPELDKELPVDLKSLVSEKFEIKWVDKDLKSHKKYYYAAKEFASLPIVIVDDDAIYDETMISKLVDGHLRHPDCICSNRVNLMQFNRKKEFRTYRSWPMNNKSIIDTPSTLLMPTGVGGVLYPPHSIPDFALDDKVIMKECINADDIWLKLTTTINGYNTVLVENPVLPQIIEGTQESALWKNNVYSDGNDLALQNILNVLEARGYISKRDLIEKLRKDRFV